MSAHRLGSWFFGGKSRSGAVHGMPRSARIATAVGLVSSLLLTGCAAGSDDESITVYNAQHDSLTKKWAEAFTEETGIKVELRSGSDTNLAHQIIAEGENSPADVFLTENSPAMSMVAEKDLFAEPSEAALEAIPENFRPSTGNWIGIAARSTVFIYNKDKVAAGDVPTSLMDLTDERWNGRWAGATSGADFQAIISAMYEMRGEGDTRAWLESLRKKDGGFNTYKGNYPVLSAVNEGQIDGGVVYHYYYVGDQAKTGENSGNVVQHYFRNGGPGSFLSLSGGGVLRSSGQSEEAEKFLNFIVSKEGQKILREESYEYPVASGVAAAEQLVPLAELDAPDIDPAKLNSRKVTELMTSIGLL